MQDLQSSLNTGVIYCLAGPGVGYNISVTTL